MAHLNSNHQLGQQGNQQVNLPQSNHQRMLVKGKKIFQRLQDNQEKEYSQFQKLNVSAMISSINSLKYWKSMGGPHDQQVKYRSQLYIQTLEYFKKLEYKRRITISGILSDFTKRLFCWGFSKPTQQTKSLTPHKGSTVSYGSQSSSLQSYGPQHRAQDAQSINVAEQDETKPLKSQ